MVTCLTTMINKSFDRSYIGVGDDVVFRFHVNLPWLYDMLHSRMSEQEELMLDMCLPHRKWLVDVTMM